MGGWKAAQTGRQECLPYGQLSLQAAQNQDNPLRRMMPKATPQPKPKKGENSPSPHGWRCIRLGGICEIIPGRHILEADHNRAGRGVPYLTGPSDFGEQHATATRWTENPDVMCQPNDVLVTVKGAGVGKINFAPSVSACIGRQLMAVRTKPGITDSHFIYFALGWLHQPLKEQAMGATVPGLSIEHLANLRVQFPPIFEQRRIAARLREQLAEVAQARAAIEAQEDGLEKLIHSLLTESLNSSKIAAYRLTDCLSEVSKGVGEKWAEYPVLGATRAGLAMAKEPVGKNPGRYKPVRPGTIFYNPMRILLGSIAMVDDDDPPGITSPDYVVMRCVEGCLHPRWFYQWFRSSYGAEFIKSMTRGAVRERLMFRRLAPASISLPDWPAQVAVAAKFVEIKRTRLALAEKLAALDNLPAALLREAFSGRL